ncbi:MAG: hypothetical protein IJN42_00980, partial [Clostridia bacterium]|nr:hypothetical protein [Clostridia bacterium]
VKQLLSRSDLPKDMEIISAAEVYLHEAILNYSTQEISQLCIPGTNLILAELPYNTNLTPSVLQRVYALIYNNNCTPVMAHIDRYLNRLKYKQIVELLDEGCRLQINLGHLERMPLVRKLRLRRLIRAGQVECCGSDCHNLSSRPPHFADPAKYLQKIAGSTIADEILTAKKLLP